MSEKARTAAIAGWHTLSSPAHLIGTQCVACGTYFFPKETHFCSNPACDSSDFREVELSRTGQIWSYTNACYPPPPPYVAAEPFKPYAIAAVQLEAEQLVVLGQVVTAVEVGELKVGMPVELVLEPLHETENEIKLTWKWKPVGSGA